MKINKFIKIVLVSFLILGFSACEDKKELKNTLVEKEIKLPKPSWDSRLSDVEADSGIWFQEADNNELAAYNIANTYSEKIKNNKKAIEWHLYSDSIKTNNKNLVNMGLTYQNMKDYENAIKYYKKAYIYNDKEAANGLGLLFRNHLKDYKKAEDWYKKAIERNSRDAVKNIALLYHFNFKEDIKASAYYISLIGVKDRDVNYTKELILRLFKDRWNLSDDTIKKGYELQLKIEGLPQRYTGGI